MAFEVNDLQAAVNRLVADGYGLVGGMGQYEHIGRMAYVRGPEGIIVSLTRADRLTLAGRRSPGDPARPRHSPALSCGGVLRISRRRFRMSDRGGSAPRVAHQSEYLTPWAYWPERSCRPARCRRVPRLRSGTARRDDERAAHDDERKRVMAVAFSKPSRR